SSGRAPPVGARAGLGAGFLRERVPLAADDPCPGPGDNWSRVRDQRLRGQTTGQLISQTDPLPRAEKLDDKKLPLFLVAERADFGGLLWRQRARDLAVREFLALDVVLDAVHNIRVRQRGHITHIGEVRDAGDHAAHDLAGPRFGHVRHDPHVRGPGDLPDLVLDRRRDLVLYRTVRLQALLQRHIHLHGPTAGLVDHRDRGGLADLLHRQAGRLQFLGAQPVAGHVDHVVHPAQNAEVAVGRLQRAVAGEVRPVVPVLALRVTAVLAVVGVHEPFGLAPDALELAGPRVADADVARPSAAGLDHLAVLVVDHRVDAQHAGTAAAGLHLLQAGERGAEKT